MHEDTPAGKLPVMLTQEQVDEAYAWADRFSREHVRQAEPEFAPSVLVSDANGLRAAAWKAFCDGTVTWVKDGHGPIAAIVPRGIAEVGLYAWKENIRP